MRNIFARVLEQQQPEQQYAQPQMQMPMPQMQQMMPPQMDVYGQQQTGLAQALMRGIYGR